MERKKSPDGRRIARTSLAVLTLAGAGGAAAVAPVSASANRSPAKTERVDANAGPVNHGRGFSITLGSYPERLGGEPVVDVKAWVDVTNNQGDMVRDTKKVDFDTADTKTVPAIVRYTGRAIEPIVEVESKAPNGDLVNTVYEDPQPGFLHRLS